MKEESASETEAAWRFVLPGGLSFPLHETARLDSGGRADSPGRVMQMGVQSSSIFKRFVFAE
jgi:hypothetical protein